METTSKLEAIIMAIIAAGTALFGWIGWLVVAWLAAMAIDYITGSAAAIKRGEWSSKRAREGLWHKGGMILVVLVAGAADLVLGALLDVTGVALPITYSVLVAPVVLTWYILTELGSTLENAVQMGAPVPSWLSKILKISANAVYSAGEQMAPPEDNNEL